MFFNVLICAVGVLSSISRTLLDLHDLCMLHGVLLNVAPQRLLRVFATHLQPKLYAAEHHPVSPKLLANLLVHINNILVHILV